MFKAVIFCGNHLRHLYVIDKIIDLFDEALIVMMDREAMIPEIPLNIPEIDKINLRRHFHTRDIIEKERFAHIDKNKYVTQKFFNIIRVSDINDNKLVNVVSKYNSNLAFVFGADVIKKPILDILPKYKINLHLGLAPWYRGSATLFWPFYHLCPQFCGYTFHSISNFVDAGDIIHQRCPRLFETDGVHDVATRCVVDAAEDAIGIIQKIRRNDEFLTKKQKVQGRLWRTSDFNPHHLRVLYNLFNDDIVSAYLNNRLGNNMPTLHSIL